MSLGVSEAEFWRLTPHKVSLIAEAHNIALKRQMEYDNTIAYLQGAYFTEAIMATVGNMLSSKTSKKHEYPDKPHKMDLDNENRESEQERQVALLKAQLDAQMRNFNLSRSKEQGQSK